MIGQNATHANFSVDDMDAAKAFYTDKLGFTVKRETPAGVMFESAAGTRFNVYTKEDHQAWDSTVFGIEVNDVKTAVDELSAQGISVEKFEGTDENGVMSDPQMGDAAWFRDPAGNWICISSEG
jgi:catechol 2,3-dioxygenase-like lactoylglutathione lyase family enzyme